ncbi:unnamed protein product [Pleuronectes platessa]|uniref:AT-rich interactive domain-containing protein 3 n=1 Tax=Pleuronectes platessa TaxID=8262 RepID=A0A9N7YHJ9_PLEPL|nr:unnamed protein product [Pleuronectes platessa]
MAKQVLDLYMLYKLVTEKGGLVEVINKKIWREITKGLNLPTSITSAAFTLRTQYMKYLYPYECDKQGLSSPGELQAAIDSNRREGRRQSYGSAIFNYSPVGTPTLLSPPKMQISHLSTVYNNSGHISQGPVIKKEEHIMASCLPSRVALHLSPSSHHAAAVAAQAGAAQAARAAALDQLREKLENGEPPEKKMMMVAEEQQRIMQHALQQNLLAVATQLPLNIKLNNRDRGAWSKSVRATKVIRRSFIPPPPPPLRRPGITGEAVRKRLSTGTMQPETGSWNTFRSLHGFVPVTPEAEATRCAKAASRCFSLRCDRHKVLTWEWMGASCYLRLGAALKRPSDASPVGFHMQYYCKYVHKQPFKKVLQL